MEAHSDEARPDNHRFADHDGSLWRNSIVSHDSDRAIDKAAMNCNAVKKGAKQNRSCLRCAVLAGGDLNEREMMIWLLQIQHHQAVMMCRQPGGLGSGCCVWPQVTHLWASARRHTRPMVRGTTEGNK